MKYSRQPASSTFPFSSFMLQLNNSLPTEEHSLVVLDPAVTDYALLAAHIPPEAVVIGLNPQTDAISQITAALHAFHRPFSSLHIVVECTPGTLNFTYGDFSLRRLRAYAEQLQKWFASSTSIPSQQRPQVFIHGSKVATDEVGKQFIDTLAWLTGASVVATAIPPW